MLALKALVSLAGHAQSALAVESSIGEPARLISLFERGMDIQLSVVALVTHILLKTPRDMGNLAQFEHIDQHRWTALALPVLHSGLDSHNIKVRSASMDAIVQWVSEALPKHQLTDKQAVLRQWRKLSKSRATLVCQSPVALQVFQLLDSDPDKDPNETPSDEFSHDMERTKAMAAFGRIVVAVGEDQALQELLSPITGSSYRALCWPVESSLLLPP